MRDIETDRQTDRDINRESVTETQRPTEIDKVK